MFSGTAQVAHQVCQFSVSSLCCDILWYYVVFYGILCYVVFCDILWYYMMLWDILWYSVMLCDLILRDVLWYYVIYDILQHSVIFCNMWYSLPFWYYVLFYCFLWYFVMSVIFFFLYSLNFGHVILSHQTVWELFLFESVRSAGSIMGHELKIRFIQFRSVVFGEVWAVFWRPAQRDWWIQRHCRPSEHSQMKVELLHNWGFKIFLGRTRMRKDR